MAASVLFGDVIKLYGRRCPVMLRAALNEPKTENFSIDKGASRLQRCFYCWRASDSPSSDKKFRPRQMAPPAMQFAKQYSHHRTCKKHTGSGDGCCSNHCPPNTEANATASPQPCWKCGRTVDDVRERYFCECGVVQPPVTRRSLFQVMGVKETFDVDLHELTEKYRDLQRILHPDKYSQKSETEKEFSLQHSSLVNRAYNTLQRPLARGLYLLHLSEDSLEQETQMSAAAYDFLDEILETNEAILEAETEDEIATIGARNQAKIDSLVLQVSEAFKNNEVTKAKELLLRLKYYSNIAEKIKESLQKHVA